MQKDINTQNSLIIYNDKIKNDEAIVASYEGYTPTTRPWYIPVKENQTSQWSSIYVNADEIMDVTITSLVPVFDINEKFDGVIGTDILLNGISEYLNEEAIKIEGFIYIVDKDWNIISNSSNKKFTQVVLDETPYAKLLNALDDVDDPMILTSAKALMNNKDKIAHFELEGETYYSSVKQLKEPNGLSWQVITIIPEHYLMGDIKRNQNFTLFFISIFAFFSLIIGFATIRKIVEPITLASQKAQKFDFETINKDENFFDSSHIKEVNSFIQAIEDLINKLFNTIEKLKESEEKYRSLVEDNEDMIFSLDESLNFISVNRSFEEMFNVKRENVINNFAPDILDPNEKGTWEKYLKKTFDTKKSQYMQSIIILNSKKELTIRTTMIPVVSNEEKVKMIVCSSSDISELIVAYKKIDKLHKSKQIELENTIMEKTKELEIAMRELFEREKLASLGSLVSGVAHEINTPLGVSVTASTYLSKILKDNMVKLNDGTMTKSGLLDLLKNIDESTSIVNINLERAATLIKSFKMISVNQTYEEITRFSLKEYLDVVLTSLKHEIKQRNHEVLVECDENLEMTSYPGFISQIITNLVMNALIHAFHESEKGIIVIKAFEKENIVNISVTDNGKGISDDLINKIFDPFFTTRRANGGSGLGLNIVYNIVTSRLKGKINVISNKGTSFIMELPKENKFHE